MKETRDKNARNLGVRVGLLFLISLSIIIFTAYQVLSRNFHQLLTDYTIQLIQSMISQGVSMVEAELDSSLTEIDLLARIFTVPEDGMESFSFPAELTDHEDTIRVIYVTETQTFTSDQSMYDRKGRPDIQAAFEGDSALYGPYFDETGQYLMCYSAPVIRDGKIIGVLGIEQDGYLFCDVIKDIHYVNSGESYILNAEGTDIAVSDPDHIDWVNSEYNGKKLLAEQEDPVTRSIVELEQKGLDGETGVGTYLWNDGICYVAYAPIPLQNWVLLAGIREEEIAAMTQSVLYSSISSGPSLPVSFILFFLLTLLIVYWIITSMRKNAQINENLEKIANHDALTGLFNRRFLETDLMDLWKYPIKMSASAAVYMADIDDFKKYNDKYGHQAGDDCLRFVADMIKSGFRGYDSYVMRYGGEEFMAVVFLIDEKEALEEGQNICRLVESHDAQTRGIAPVTISIGVCHVDLTLGLTLYESICNADHALYEAKQTGKNKAVLYHSQE